MGEGRTVEAVLRRDRAVVLAGLAGLTALAWAYLLTLAWRMPHRDLAMAMATPHMQVWGAPMVLTFATLNRRRQAQQGPFVPTGVFLLGYLLVWSAFSVVATGVQWGLHTAALLSPMMVSTSPALGGLLLLAAGIFQWTPLKSTCLTQCRSPLGFLTTEWREGVWGAILMGLRHGSYCVGCCWVLMALLWVAGVMNLLWVAAIATFVLVEKILPRGALVGRVAGGVFMLAGLLLLAQMWRT
jgi:predicted metal-binding membrane protein